MPEMIRLWLMCRPGGMPEMQRLPDAGGPADQSPFVMDCLAILDTALAGIQKEVGGNELPRGNP